ncbi:hypothetical protein [Endozoicomonas sp. ISHI1]|uniref:hypothetical protein n=1 Tax=Endozoicomonas sp. ISHI1 TaxID=2825882 RepID=UPI002148C785
MNAANHHQQVNGRVVIESIVRIHAISGAGRNSFTSLSYQKDIKRLVVCTDPTGC